MLLLRLGKRHGIVASPPRPRGHGGGYALAHFIGRWRLQEEIDGRMECRTLPGTGRHAPGMGRESAY
jgi:hypothetical protein